MYLFIIIKIWSYNAIKVYPTAPKITGMMVTRFFIFLGTSHKNLGCQLKLYFIFYQISALGFLERFIHGLIGS